ncbi:MAG: ribonuclease [Solirubrobacterales bacterium]|nr:ribonuclease [Solirubrobacterales bacterium]
MRLLAALAVCLCALPLLGASGCDEGGEGTTATVATSGASNGPSASGPEGGEIARVLATVDAGGQLPYEEDGGTFENREGLLPDHPLGYYREYTVVTPGEYTRGARRLVIGEGGEVFYTSDHYSSFIRIDPGDYGGSG